MRSVYGDFSPAASIAMDANNNTLLGVASGSKPLEVVVPSFEVRTVEQSSPLAGVINTITISIKANCDLPAGSIVTIQQLTGSQTASSDALRIEAGHGGFAATGVWNGSMSDPESLVLTSTGMQVASTYEARFNLTNPATNQSSPGVSIKADVRSVYGDFSPVVSVTMFKVTSSLLSVPNGYQPLEVHTPSFLTKAIGQSHPFPGSSNIITVTLVPSCDFEALSRVTIFGLTGSLTEDVSGSFPADTTSSVQWFSATSWSQVHGNFSMTLFSSGTPSSRYNPESFIALKFNTSYVFSFHLRNSLSVQPSPLVSIHAALWSPFGELTSTFVEALTKKHAAVLQVPGGSDPMLIWNATAIMKRISQSNPLAQASNIITVTFQTNFEVLPGSTFTISGLTGALTPDSDRLGLGDGPIANPSHTPNRFDINFSKWTQSKGQLEIRVATASLQPFEEHVLQFHLRNPAEEQPSPDIFLNISLEPHLDVVLTRLNVERHLGVVATSIMETLNEFRLGIPNASRPLSSIFPNFEVKFIRQDYPYPNFLNTLSVSLKLNCNLEPKSVITISGLTGSQTRASTISVIETQEMGYKKSGYEYELDPRTWAIHMTTSDGALRGYTHSLDSHQKLLDAEGLRGSSLLTSDEMGNVVVYGVGGHFESKGVWNQNEGQLLITVSNQTYVNTTYEVQVNLTQPVDNTDFPRNVTIKGYVESGAFDAPIRISEMVQSTTAIYGVAGGSAPFFTHQASAVNLALTQQSPFPGLANVIQARFAFDMALVPGAEVTISGFKSMQTVSTSTQRGFFGTRLVNALACEIIPFGFFSHLCEFDQRKGEVLLTVVGRGTKEYHDYHVNFTLINPASASLSNRLRISATIPHPTRGPSAAVVDSLQNYNSSEYNPPVIQNWSATYGSRVPIFPSLFEVPQKGLLGVAQRFSNRIASVDPETCHNFSVVQRPRYNAQVADLLHTCMFDNEMPVSISVRLSHALSQYLGQSCVFFDVSSSCLCNCLRMNWVVSFFVLDDSLCMFVQFLYL